MIRIAIALLPAAALGCRSTPPGYFERAGIVESTGGIDARNWPRNAACFAPDGQQLAWGQVMDAVGWADVVFLGEQHDDGAGHAIQQAIVDDALARSRRVVVSLEMLERDEQPLVDDYFDGIIDAGQFEQLTHSTGWGGGGQSQSGEGSWADWYQPVIDAARDGGGRVLAANAPRRYVRLARRSGYDALDALPRQRRQWVEHPATLPQGHYWQRFVEVMTAPMPQEPDDQDDDRQLEEHVPPMEEDQSEPVSHPEPEPEPQEPEPAHPHVSEDELRALFRSQLVWDATMASSIARALHFGAGKVIHLVGGFHCEFDGGTVLELRKRRPGARILVIALVPEDARALRAEDRGRADIVVYTATAQQ